MHGFMIQGGCPLREGFGGPGYNIKGEFSANGFENNLRHERGVLSMARSNAYDSAGSQFFIMHADNTGLDGLYAAFGRVTSGMDVVDRIAAVPAIDNNGTVLDENKPTITSITIDSDTELPEPDKLG
jgi:peptidyl-prolyl cis-trans isomerase B (cyclophilin B)